MGDITDMPRNTPQQAQGGTVKSRLARSLFVAIAGAALIGGGATSASAETPEVTRPDRVIDVDHAYTFPNEDSHTSPVGAKKSLANTNGERIEFQQYTSDGEADFDLKVGETVQVNYTNATAIVVQPYATCQTAATASSPYKSNGEARGNVSMKISSGCPNSWTSSWSLSQRTAVGYWNQYGTMSTTVKPGQQYFYTAYKKCGGTGKRAWRTAITMNSIGGGLVNNNTSSNSTLACYA